MAAQARHSGRRLRFAEMLELLKLFFQNVKIEIPPDYGFTSSC